jgi:hypothetical protein
MAPALPSSAADARALRFELNFFRSPKPVVGLDIGSSAVKAVELKPNGSKGFKIAAYASESIPPDTIVDGAVIDAVTVADAIRRIFDTKRFKAKDVVASLSGNAVIVKKIALPVMTDAELADSIHWEAEQYIPFRSTSRTSTSITRCSIAARPIPASRRWTCCSLPQRRTRSPTTRASFPRRAKRR